MSTVLTIGTWDPVHADHVALMHRCERYADQVLVGVNSDTFVRTYRREPAVFTEKERMEQVEAVGYQPLLNDGPGRELIDRVRPTLIAVGSDWLARDYMGQIGVTVDWLEDREIGLLFLPRGTTISSTAMKERFRA